MKMKYDESDNAFIRASRAVTDKVTDLIGNVPPLPCECSPASELRAQRRVVLGAVTNSGTGHRALLSFAWLLIQCPAV